MYTVRYTSRAQRELINLPPETFDAIIQVLSGLEKNPRPVETVKLWDAVYRIRVGQWRIIYEIRDREQTIAIGKIARRSESTYRGIRDLF